jgi:plastocyanin
MSPAAARRRKPRFVFKYLPFTLAAGLLALAGCGEGASSTNTSTNTSANTATATNPAASTPTSAAVTPATSQTATSSTSTTAAMHHGAKPKAVTPTTSSTPAHPTSASPSPPASTSQASAPAHTNSHSSSPANPAPTSTTLHLEANREGQLKYDRTSLTAGAGTVSIDFTNMAPLGHNLTVASSSGSVVGATPTIQGTSKTLTLNLTPGSYKFYCSVPGHRMAGMEGTLTVR